MTQQELNSRVNVVRCAFENNNITDIEFYADGSGVCFTFKYLNECYNRIDNQSMSLPMHAAILCLQGYRCKQHENIRCY